MAPELRKRKVVETSKSNGASTKVVEKTVTKPKRKAAEDASPVSLKKQKSTKKTVVEPKGSAPASTVKKSKKQVKAVEESTADSDDDESGEENAQALALQVDADEEDPANGVVLFEPGQDVGQAPEASTQLQSKPKTGTPGVIYIGRIPHGFYEYEMRQYFSQFGPINKLRLSRNKKTGASKHFAFIEFAEETTAEIVAKTMNNYLLFGHILKCEVIPKERIHEDLFKGANKRFKQIPWNKMAGNKLTKPLTESAWEGKVSREKGRRADKAAKLKAMGYEFEAPELKEVPAPVAIEIADEVKAIEAAPEAEADSGEAETKTIVEVEATIDGDEVQSVSATKQKQKRGKGKKAKA